MSDRVVSHARQGTTRGLIGVVICRWRGQRAVRNVLVDFGGRLTVMPHRCLRRVK